MGERAKRYVWIFPVLWMGVIFMFSHQPGTESSELSGSFALLIEKALGIFNYEVDWLLLHHLIRIAAHFTIFFILGALWYGVLRSWNIWATKAAIIALSISVAYALLDEFHQYFIPGRACDIKDVMTDTVGAMVAISIGWIYSRVNRKLN